jgi:hypothetical protein
MSLQNKLKTCSASIAVAVLLSGCADIGSKSIDDAQREESAYIAAKRDYVRLLEQSLLAKDPAGSPYRLVAIVGPQWGVGDVMDPTNPMSLLTEKCRQSSTAPAPVAVRWAGMPAYTSGKKITLKVGLPSSVASFIGKEKTLGIHFDTDSGGIFSLSEITSVIPAKDTFESGLTAACKEYLTQYGGYLIRGVVSAKEKFSSTKKIEFGSDIKMLSDPLFAGQYASNGAFVLEDAAPNPKMFVVTLFLPANRGTSVVSRSPTSEEVAELESVNIDGK